MTALHWAVRANDAPTVQMLIRAGANVNAANRYGMTPLLLAAQNGDPTRRRRAAQGRRRTRTARCRKARRR